MISFTCDPLYLNILDHLVVEDTVKIVHAQCRVWFEVRLEQAGVVTSYK